MLSIYYRKHIWIVLLCLFPISSQCYGQIQDSISQVILLENNRNISVRLFKNHIQFKDKLKKANVFEDTTFFVKSSCTILKVDNDGDLIIDLSTNKAVTQISILLNKIGNLKVIGNGRTELSIILDTKAEMEDNGAQAKGVYIANCLVKEIILPNSRISSLSIFNSDVKYINFNNSKISDNFIVRNSAVDSSSFFHTYLPSFLYLDRVKLENKGALNFSSLIYLANTENQPALELERTIQLKEIDFDKLSLQYDRFSFHVDSLQDKNHRIWIYQKILKHMSSEGMLAQSARYNQDYNELLDSINRQDFTNKISEIWWNKGRSKTRVVLWCIGFFCSFLILNYKYRKLLPLVYFPKNFERYFACVNAKYTANCMRTRSRGWTRHTVKSICSNCYGIFFYTSFIFWGLKLNLNDLKFSNLWLVTLIIAQYITGLIFVAYIVSFIIIRL